MRTLFRLVGAATLLFAAVFARAAIIRVPTDYATIQAAINAASALTSDTVLVSNGTYLENIDFLGKAITVRSVNGPNVTTIDGQHAGSVVRFGHGEGLGSVLSGFTLQNGYAVEGSGASVWGASPTITSNIFQNNAQPSGYFGAAISGNNSSPRVIGNLFRNNTADSQFLSGVVAFVNGSSPLIANNVFLRNSCRAINMTLPTGNSPIVINNTIVSNTVGIRVDARVDTSAQIYLNNLLVGNDIGLQVDFSSSGNQPTWRNNLVFAGQNYSGIPDLTGTNGNISADPLFACLPSDDYHLLGVSPALDAGTNGAPQLPEVDFDGAARIQAHVTNSTAVVDIGAYEFNPALPPTPCIYVNCPGNIVVTAAAGQNSAVVTYPPPTGAPVATITSSPPSGSVFPGGTNVVTCTAVYGTNSNFCTFTVTVLIPPILTNLPLSTNVPAGQAFSLSVAPGGTPPFTYQWRFENSTIAGTTGSTLTVSNAQAVNEGIYRVIAANSVGSVTSAVMWVRVMPAAPTTVSNPAPLLLPASSSALFSVTALGSQPLAYQWFFGGASIAGATNSQLALSGIQSSNTGNYQVVVTNSLGGATSTVASLTVTPTIPYFITVPLGAQVSEGSNRTFTGLADGSQPIHYQWQRDGTNLPGATQTSLSLSNLSLTDSGAYTLIASNIAGASTSIVAQLTVFQNPTVLQFLTNQVVDAGDTVVLSVGAVGSPTLVYSWQLNGQQISGSNSTLTLTNIQTSQSGYYRVAISNQFGTASSTARVSVLGPMASVIAWGDNSGGQTNIPVGFGAAVAIAGGDYHSIALRHDGTLAGWGYNGDGQASVPTNALRFVAISAGASHNLAITENGSLVSWGRNDAGQRNIPGSASNGVVSTAAGDSHSLALLGNGTVVGWGDNSFGQISIPQGLTGVRAIAAGRLHSLALRANGTVAAWGYNTYGQATVPAGLSNVVAIAAGYLHSSAVLSNGTAVVWGNNDFGQTNVPPTASNLVAVAAGDFHAVALRANGTLASWGGDDFGQVDVPPGLANVVTVTSGNYHSLALTTSPGILEAMVFNSKLVLQWNGFGVLQSAPTLAGPFADVPCLGNSYTNLDISSPTLFFRLRR